MFGVFYFGGFRHFYLFGGLGGVLFRGLFVCFCFREGRGRGRKRVLKRLHAQYRARGRTQLHNLEILTEPKLRVECLTNRTTQAPLFSFDFN